MSAPLLASFPATTCIKVIGATAAAVIAWSMVSELKSIPPSSAPSEPITAESVAARLAYAEGMFNDIARKIPEVDVLTAQGFLDREPGTIILVDVREDVEIAVSRIRGALTKAEFEAMCPTAADVPAGVSVAAYCTLGYRSGCYARDHLLKGPRALPHDRVFNHQGVMLHTFTGQPLVRRRTEEEQHRATVLRVAAAGDAWENTPNVHLADKDRAEYIQRVPEVNVLSAAEYLLRAPGSSILVDVRTEEEVNVGRIRGAITKTEFEARYTTAADIPAGACVVAYCTAGYRSGCYARDHLLKGPRALPHDRVFNHQGVIRHTFTGQPLVVRTAKAAEAAEAARMAAAGDTWEDTTEVHSNGRAWSGTAHPAYRVSFFD